MLILKVKSADGSPSELGFKIPQADLLTNLYDNWLDELEFLIVAIKEYQQMTIKRGGGGLLSFLFIFFTF